MLGANRIEGGSTLVASEEVGLIKESIVLSRDATLCSLVFSYIMSP